MIVFSEDSEKLFPSTSARDIHASTEAAKLMGCKVYHIASDFSGMTEEAILWHVSKQEPETIGIWIGYIPTSERYQLLYRAALTKGIHLINSPEEHLRCQEFDRTYPFLEGLTPSSVVLHSADECAQVSKQFGFPLFVKGSVRSQKQKGWTACVAENFQELESLVEPLLASQDKSRGCVIVRKLAPLRHQPTTGFPLGREYRVFVFQNQVVGLGYYWEGGDPFGKLTPKEFDAINTLALEASRRLSVPFISPTQEYPAACGGDELCRNCQRVREHGDRKHHLNVLNHPDTP